MHVGTACFRLLELFPSFGNRQEGPCHIMAKNLLTKYEIAQTLLSTGFSSSGSDGLSQPCHEIMRISQLTRQACLTFWRQ